MARRVHQVELIKLAILRPIIEPHGLRLDRDAALLLDLHVVEHLRLPAISRVGHAAADLDEPVGKRRLAVIDMGDDGEIADVLKRRHALWGGIASGSALGIGCRCVHGAYIVEFGAGWKLLARILRRHSSALTYVLLLISSANATRRMASARTSED